MRRNEPYNESYSERIAPFRRVDYLRILAPTMNSFRLRSNYSSGTLIWHVRSGWSRSRTAPGETMVNAMWSFFARQVQSTGEAL